MRFRSSIFLPIGEFRDRAQRRPVLGISKNTITHSVGLQLDLLQSAKERSGRLQLEILQSLRKRSGGITTRNSTERRRTLWRYYR